MMQDKLKGMLVGLAIGDTLGMPLEFKQLGTFKPLKTLEGGGSFDLPLGYWTDDTSMALCLADSILDIQGYDSFNVMERYAKWQDEGYRSSTGVCFDIGNQTSAAISRYKAQPTIPLGAQRTSSAGNGCIMRLAPVVIASIAAGDDIETTMRISAISARETHFSSLAEDATAIFGGLLYKAASAASKNEVLQFDNKENLNGDMLAGIERASQQTENTLKPTGYVVDTLEVAVWAFMTTDNFQDGALKAVNLGGDADTIGAVYGQLAGAYYGLEAIPSKWRNQLYEYQEIAEVASRLSEIIKFEVIKTRFDEDREGLMLKYNHKENKMSDDNQAQEPLTQEEIAALKSWSDVGSPGAAPTTPFVPGEEQKQRFQSIKTARTIAVEWNFDQEAYKKFQYGHEAHEMEDKWNIYMENDTVHFYRSWTGFEVFRLTVEPTLSPALNLDHKPDEHYIVSNFEVEQDPERYTATNEQEIKNELVEVLQAVLGVSARSN